MNTPNPPTRAMPFIFTNDDPGSGDVRLFHELLDFLRDEGVPGTFFLAGVLHLMGSRTQARTAHVMLVPRLAAVAASMLPESVA